MNNSNDNNMDERSDENISFVDNDDNVFKEMEIVDNTVITYRYAKIGNTKKAIIAVMVLFHVISIMGLAFYTIKADVSGVLIFLAFSLMTRFSLVFNDELKQFKQSSSGNDTNSFPLSASYVFPEIEWNKDNRKRSARMLGNATRLRCISCFS